MKTLLMKKPLEDSFSREAEGGSYGREKSSGGFHLRGCIMADVKRLIGDRIRQLRKEKGLSQEKLGYESELHCTHIGSIERGQKNWSIDTLIKVAKGLNVEVADLFNFPMPPADAKKLKKALFEDINASSPESVKILSNLLNGLKSLKKTTP